MGLCRVRPGFAWFAGPSTAEWIGARVVTHRVSNGVGSGIAGQHADQTGTQVSGAATHADYDRG